MANPEHLRILKQGVKVWNQWRNEHPEIRPDLSYVNLANSDLTYVDLSDVDLTGAALYHVHLTDADLSRALLNDAILTGAYLLDANLSRVHLVGANLSFAMLVGTKLNGASFGFTAFDNIDLSKAVGLETVNHFGPSDVGIGTIYYSQGKIPEVFLRSCGVPESFIAQIPALVAAIEPIQFYSCFISYSSKNQDFANRLYADLQNKGVRCWFAPEDMKTGDEIRTRIDESILYYDKLLLILSEQSISSGWVKKEVETAMEREADQQRAILFPVRLDDTVMEIKTGWPADVRRTRHIGDFTRWKDHESYQNALDRLLRDLKAEDRQAAEAERREGSGEGE